MFDGVTNFSDSVVKLSPTGSLLDYFTPFDQDVMQQNDINLGSLGPVILPDAVGSSAYSQLLIATGKADVVYLLDRTNLGQYNIASNQDLGEVIRRRFLRPASLLEWESLHRDRWRRAQAIPNL